MSEFYDNMDRAFCNELDLCVTKNQGIFCNSRFKAYPDGAYELRLGMRRLTEPTIITARILNTYEVQTGISTFGTEGYAKIIVRDMVITLYQELIKREIININARMKEKADDGVERVIFNPPATIVFWKDGTKTVVKCQEDDDWDEEKALAMAIVKHDHGLSAFNKTLKKAERRYPDSGIDMSSLVDGFSSAAKPIPHIFECEQDIEHTCKNCRNNKIDWSCKHEKDMPFCSSDNPMINHYKSITEDYEDFYCKDFEPKEEKMFKLKEIAGPFGDCTSIYSVELDAVYTVKEFIDAVLEHRSNEWGSIEIENLKAAHECEYANGTIKCGLFSPEILRKTVISAKARGGWTRMDYQLKIQM